MKKVSLTIPFEKNEAVVFPTLPSFSTKSLHHFSREMNSPPPESSETQQSTSYSAFLLKKKNGAKQNVTLNTELIVSCVHYPLRLRTMK